MSFVYTVICLTDNTGGLRISVNGHSLVVPMLLTCSEPGKGYQFAFEVERGPKLYEYPPIRVGINSECDTIDFPPFADQSNPSNLVFSASFVRPCPTVEFTGELWDEETFVVNIETDEDDQFPSQLLVMARNPENTLWKNSLTSGSGNLEVDWLKKGQVQYRRQGEASTAWRPALDVDGDPLDLIASETDYGFSQVHWNTAPLPDGQYQLRLRMECRYIADAPLGINEAFSSVPVQITGLIDRTPPILFGIPEPADQEYAPGDEISAEFTEELLCNRPFRFKINLLIPGYQRVLDQNNLHVICNRNKIRIGLPATAPYDDVMVCLYFLFLILILLSLMFVGQACLPSHLGCC